MSDQPAVTDKPAGPDAATDKPATDKPAVPDILATRYASPAMVANWSPRHQGGAGAPAVAGGAAGPA